MKKEELRENLSSLELTDEVFNAIYSAANALAGKDITALKEQIETLNANVSDKDKEIAEYKNQIDSLNENGEDSIKLQEELKNLKQSIADREAREREYAVNKQIEESLKDIIGDKKFVNDYTKNALISEVKTALNSEDGQFKGIKQIFNEITKDRDGIFEASHKPAEMASLNVGHVDQRDIISKEQFDKSGYKTRLQLKQEYPDVYAEYTNKN